MITDWEDTPDRECSMLSVDSGFTKAISSSVNSSLAHKVVDAVVKRSTATLRKVGKAVVKGATSAGQKAVESVVNNAIDSTKKWIVGKKRSIQPSSVTDPIIAPQKRKLDIDSLIDGSGIVLDQQQGFDFIFSRKIY